MNALPDMEPPERSYPPLRTVPTLRGSFSELMRLHHSELLIFAGAATRDATAAEDIVQESFVSAWKKFADFDSDRDFGAWMRGFVRHKTQDWFRRQQRIAPPVGDLDFLEAATAQWQTARAEGHPLSEAISHCLDRLPQRFREAIDHFYFDDRSGEETAAALEISPANLRKRLQRARALLHDCIGSHPDSKPS
ncbi:MAG: RNA polymerase sigma factor [Verrucomicrobiota bacterium]